MKRSGLLLLLCCLVAVTGCSLFHRKAKRAPAAPELPPATSIQVEYRDRWVERRAHELLAAGSAKTEPEARAMATAEFAKQFPYITPLPAKAGR